MNASSAFRYAVVMAGLWWLVLRRRRDRPAGTTGAGTADGTARTRPPDAGPAHGAPGARGTRAAVGPREGPASAASTRHGGGRDTPDPRPH